MTKNKGWYGEPRRHELARKGVKTKNIKLTTKGKYDIETEKYDIEGLCMGCGIERSYGHTKNCIFKTIYNDIKQWNNGKIPRTKKAWDKFLKEINDEISSGYWANNPEYLEELYRIKKYVSIKVKSYR